MNAVEARPPLRRRSSTFIAISNWALAVQPGSPSPISPHLSPYLNLVETPTSPAKFDLTNLGYTSVFVHLPHTPSTPAVPPVPPVPQSPQLAPQSSQPVHQKGLKKFRSLGMLKANRKGGKSVASPPPAPAKKPSAAAPLPPTLANELLLMQFMGGGSLETHAKRVMQNQAREAAPAGKPKGSAPVGTVYRDGSGNMWWDAEEAIEYEALLPRSPGSPQTPGRTWVIFGSPTHHTLSFGDEERRGSFTSSMSSSPSLSLSLNRIITPAPIDHSARAMHLLRLPALPFPSESIANRNASLAEASGNAARNNRNRRRRPAPLKLHSSPAVPTAMNGFDDSFAPSPAPVSGPRTRTHRTVSKSGDISAPATCTEFETPLLEKKKNSAGKPSTSRSGFKGKAKALLGGFA